MTDHNDGRLSSPSVLVVVPSPAPAEAEDADEAAWSVYREAQADIDSSRDEPLLTFRDPPRL